MSEYGLGVLFEAVPSMIDHYSTRYVLNDNDGFCVTFSDENKVNEWTDSDLRISVESGQKYNSPDENAKLLIKNLSLFHGEDCFKWCFDDGRELVFNKDSTGKYQVDLNYNTLGTFNFGDPSSLAQHYILDMDSYIKWGNTPDDLYGSKSQDWKLTPWRRRVLPAWQNAHDYITNSTKNMNNWY